VSVGLGGVYPAVRFHRADRALDALETVVKLRQQVGEWRFCPEVNVVPHGVFKFFATDTLPPPFPLGDMAFELIVDLGINTKADLDLLTHPATPRNVVPRGTRAAHYYYELTFWYQ
jgi:hypothetical protein